MLAFKIGLSMDMKGTRMNAICWALIFFDKPVKLFQLIYNVFFRQTQWEPPVADRSPPTPELGYLGDELDSSMDPNVFSSHVPQDVTMVGEVYGH